MATSATTLKSALDHLWWQLWTRVDPAFDERVYFPIFSSEERFEKARPFKVKGLTLPVTHQAVTKRAQPYNRGNNYLTILHELNRTDKHRLISVADTCARVGRIGLYDFDLDTLTSIEDELIIAIKPNVRVEKGTMITRVPLGHRGSRIKGHVHVGLDSEFRFTEPKIVAGLGVTTTMRQLRDEVRWVLDQF